MKSQNMNLNRFATSAVIAGLFLGCSLDPKRTPSDIKTTKEEVLRAQNLCRSSYPVTEGNLYNRTECQFKAASPLLAFEPEEVRAKIENCQSEILNLAKKVDDGQISQAEWNNKIATERQKCSLQSSPDRLSVRAWAVKPTGSEQP
jgi:hypothetical protein